MTSTGINIKMVDIGHWALQLTDSIRVPTEQYPIGCLMINGKTILVRPDTITQMSIHALKKPKVPVYAFTTSGDYYVYDDANSIDFEWPEILHDEIVNRVLGNLGMSQREPSLVQYSNTEKQIEGR